MVQRHNGLCFSGKKQQPVYITKRFDILPDGTKMAMEDFAAVIGRNEANGGKYYKYEGSYDEIAAMIRKYVAALMVDMERFFELVVFNYIYANGDDHMKNFSLIRQGDDYRLAPAYDLMNTCLHVNGDDFGLNGGLSQELVKSDTYSGTGYPCRSDFEWFGLHIGIRPQRVKSILDKYEHIPDIVKILISHSFLDDKAKRLYIRIITERAARFNIWADVHAPALREQESNDEPLFLF